MLKVLQLIPTLDRSGAEKQLVLLAKGLPRDRFRVEVAALTRLGPLAQELERAGIPVTLLGKRHKLDPLALNRLIRHIREGNFDVVHTWIYAADTYGRVAARAARVPVVVTSEMAVDLWKSKAELKVDRFLARWTDRVVGNSDAVVEFYRKAGIPTSKLAMIYSGIEPAVPPAVDGAEVRRSLGLEPDAPLVLFAGRLAAQKGVDDLLNAADLLHHIRPGVRYLIVGDGPLRGRLEEMARGLHLGGVVQFLGHRDDVPSLMSACDAVVLPSHYEGLPNVVLEAMLAGKPVVATDAPGTTEVVVDGETGILVPRCRPPRLAQALRTVLDDRTLALRLGETGRQRALSSFGVDAMVGRFAQLYEDIATAKGRMNGINQPVG